MIKVGSIGAIDADYRKSHGYYMVEFRTSPHTLQKNITIYGKLIDYEEVVANGSYFSPAIYQLRWYVTPRDVNI